MGFIIFLLNFPDTQLALRIFDQGVLLGAGDEQNEVDYVSGHTDDAEVLKHKHQDGCQIDRANVGKDAQANLDETTHCTCWIHSCGTQETHKVNKTLILNYIRRATVKLIYKVL